MSRIGLLLVAIVNGSMSISLAFGQGYDVTRQFVLQSPGHGPELSWHGQGDCGTNSGESGRLTAFLQKSHWGYCNYFDERPFGDALVAALGGQVRRGRESMLMLYGYDFYPRGSQRAGELTPRGGRQLKKTIERMQTIPGPIVIQITENDADLNNKRYQHVIEALAVHGLEHLQGFVILDRQKYGLTATDAVVNAENLEQSVRSRGFTIRSGGSATFGGGNN